MQEQTERKLRNLTIEITGKCNLQCTHCAQLRLKENKQFGAIMPPEMFNRILDHLINLGMIDGQNGPGDPFQVCLHSWGEPLLHPKINAIFRILKDKHFKATVSANLGFLPDIEKDLLPVLGCLTLSLSGFTQESYDKIHGQSLPKVLDNFEHIYADLRRYSPETVIKISWHRYRFNEREFWDAHRYFDRPGISMKPVVAFLNDGALMVDFLQGRLSPERTAMAEKNIDLDRMRKRGEYHRKKSTNYFCKQWTDIVIDEHGRLMTCCAFSGYDAGNSLGNVLEMSADDIWGNKKKSTLCGECLPSGAARFIHKLDASVPSGGGAYGLKLRARTVKEYLQNKFSFDYFRRKVAGSFSRN